MSWYPRWLTRTRSCLSVDRSKVGSEHLDGKRGPRGKYTTMDAARVVEHKTDGRGPGRLAFYRLQAYR